ncbi:MAG TPA: YggT family protein [Gemmatimonadaceae bacterium]|jgi:YggT family protein|nr:YggT family protein [Gemmatimonadaceae bacterium]
METFLMGADAVIQILRTALLSIAIVFGAICVLDWAVRTRKISPFNSVARFCRTTIDPFIAPIEKRVIRAGGTPASAPLWALAAVVIGGILLLTLLDVVRIEVIRTIVASQEGSAGIFHLLVSWTFTILRFALIVRVISSWLPISPYSPWIRWSYALSEPILAPLRRVVPNLGGLDITPILAYFLLSIVESVLFRLM